MHASTAEQKTSICTYVCQLACMWLCRTQFSMLMNTIATVVTFPLLVSLFYVAVHVVILLFDVGKSASTICAAS